jgi:hypothetical protein
LYEANAALVRQRLIETRRFPLTPDDLAWIAYALEAFYTDGPDIHYGRLRPGDAPGPSYRLLMGARDIRGQGRSYLASEDAFQVVRDLHLSVFYGSNVEVYLNREKTRAFCASLATLPHDSRTWFIGGKGLQPLASKLKSCGVNAP